MLTMSGYRLIGYDNGGWQAGTDRDPESRPVDLDRMQGERPDLSDPATLGCLLALVREAWGDPEITTNYHAIEVAWWVGAPGVNQSNHGTEAEALVAALECAP